MLSDDELQAAAPAQSDPVKLDCVIFGVGRSGTTAIVAGLNGWSDTFCGNELLKVGDDHSDLHYPESFFVEKLKATGTQYFELSRLIAKRPSPRFICNKTPYYFLQIDKILPHVRNRCAVACIRHPADVARSVNLRAADPEDQWPADRHGFFSALELPIMLLGCLQAPHDNMLLVPYPALRQDFTGTLADIRSHFGGPLPGEIDTEFTDAGKQESRDALSTTKPPVSPSDEEALSLVCTPELDTLLAIPKAEPFALHTDAVRAYLQSITRPPVELGLELAERSASQGVVKFAKGWANRNNRLLARLGQDFPNLGTHATKPRPNPPNKRM